MRSCADPGACSLPCGRTCVKGHLYYLQITLDRDAADMVLPSATYAEKDGSFTNFEGRVQSFKKALNPLGASRPTLEILQDLADAVGAHGRAPLQGSQ